MFNPEVNAALKREGDEIRLLQVEARKKLFLGISDALKTLNPMEHDYKKFPHAKALPGFFLRRRSVEGTLFEPIHHALVLMGIRCQPTIGATVDALDLNYEEYRYHFMLSSPGDPFNTMDTDSLSHRCRCVGSWGLAAWMKYRIKWRGGLA